MQTEIWVAVLCLWALFSFDPILNNHSLFLLLKFYRLFSPVGTLVFFPISDNVLCNIHWLCSFVVELNDWPLQPFPAICALSSLSRIAQERNSQSIPFISFKWSLNLGPLQLCVLLPSVVPSSLPLLASRSPPLLHPNTFLPVYNPQAWVPTLTTHYPDKGAPVEMLPRRTELIRNLPTQGAAMSLNSGAFFPEHISDHVLHLRVSRWTNRGRIWSLESLRSLLKSPVCTTLLFYCKAKTAKVFCLLSDGILISSLSQFCNIRLKIHFQNH